MLSVPANTSTSSESHGAIWRAIWWAGRKQRGGLVRAALGTLVATSLTVAALTLADTSRRQLGEIAGSAEERLRVVVARPHAFGTRPTTLLSSAALTELARLPGVVAVYPEAWARFPTLLRSNAFGQSLVAEGALLGIDPRAVGAPAAFRFVPGEPIPVLVPRSVLAVYNGSFAEHHALPRLDERLLRGVRFEIVAGASTFGSSPVRAQRVVAARIVGITAYGDALAALVPLQALDWLHKQMEPGAPAGGRTAAQLSLRVASDPAALATELQRLGLRAEPAQGGLARLAKLLEVARGSALAIGGIAILATTFVTIQLYGLALRLRRGEWHTLFALGVPRRTLRAAATLECAGAVLFACALGLLLGGVLAYLAVPVLQTLASDASGVAFEPTLTTNPATMAAALLLAPCVTAIAVQWPLSTLLNGEAGNNDLGASDSH